MSKTLFISDLHLQDSEPALTAALFKWLHKQVDDSCDALYILGDLFEYWLGDDDDQPLALDVCAAFRTAATRCPVFIMHGNRDFLLGEDFCQRSGAQLLPDPTTITLYGKHALLMHGDSLCIDDSDYQQLRAHLRAPVTQADLLAKPLHERRQIADQLRSMSKQAMSNKAEDIMDVNGDEVERQMRAHGVQWLIHGHTHRPKVHPLGPRRRMVLGDWGAQLWYLQVTPSGAELISEPIP